MSDKYRIAECARGDWHVVAENGHPVYDDATDGNHKLLIFADSDAAAECAARLSKENEEPPVVGGPLSK